jgi:hypothetical protein
MPGQPAFNKWKGLEMLLLLYATIYQTLQRASEAMDGDCVSLGRCGLAQMEARERKTSP